jgi:5-methylthioribose kinase
MKEGDVAAYVTAKVPDFFKSPQLLKVKEIGDGNLNYVFRVVNENDGCSLIVKQAGPALRISAEMRVSTSRNRLESEILLLQEKYAGGLVPRVYQYDTVMCACMMEDLSDYQLMRYALMEHRVFPSFAEDITDYMVNTLLNTTDIVMDHKAKKELVRRFINPELCEITEDLVYTEPYNDVKGRNLVLSENLEFVKNELYGDKNLCLEAAKLKFEFMNNAQALLHGDLHTGSIFVKEKALGGERLTRVFDPEFAFYGPMGYDIGNVIANLFFAWHNGNAAEQRDFCEWALLSAVSVIDLFKQKFLDVFSRNVTDVMAMPNGFAGYYLAAVISDAAACTGLELIRRTVGMAKVKDITEIPDRKKRVIAERVNILCAKDCILNRSSFKSGQDFAAALLGASSRV